MLDKKEYTLNSVTGAITINNGTITPESKLYKVNYYHSYNRKPYLHTFDRARNIFTNLKDEEA